MERILLVDDEPLVLKAMYRLLNRTPCLCEGHLFRLELLTFTDPAVALEYVRAHEVSLILSDYRMPQMDGVALLSACRALQPDAPRLIVSGYADLNALIGAINEAQIYRFLAKPWRDYELVSTVAQALRHRQLQLENQRLADIYHLQRKALSPQELERQRLEMEEPGLTKVRWAADGSVILDEDET
jgi:Response regulator containing CheY-like receiver, AAA-type ATPase, and DNA-binding domains